MTMVHGDDFVSVGTREATKRFKKQLEGRFEIKTQIIGSGPAASHACVYADRKGLEPSSTVKTLVLSACNRTGETTETEETQEGRVLNRVIRWTEDGWEIDPDQRHADSIVHELGYLIPDLCQRQERQRVDKRTAKTKNSWTPLRRPGMRH